MSQIEAVPGTDDPWEAGKLGRDCDHVEVAPPDLKKEIDTALEMQMISIRFPKQLLDELKAIAKYRGMGYQPLIREIMTRFSRTEILTIVAELQEHEKARAALAEHESQNRKTA